MSFCTECGARLNPSAKFCNQCGFKVRGSSPEEHSPKNFSPSAQSGSATVDSGYDVEVPDSAYAGSDRYPSLWENSKQNAPSAGGPSSRPVLMKDASRPLPSLAEVGFQPTGQEGRSNKYARPAEADRKQRPYRRSPEALREEARQVVKNFSLWCAGVVLFPVPFYDLVLLMPIQTGMIMSIGRVYKNQDPPEKVLANIAAACGASVFGQITTLVVANVIPIIGKLVSAPFIYGWTYGMGEVAIRYFESEGKMGQDEMKEVFRQVSRDATKAFSREDVQAQGDSLEKLREHLSPEEYEKLRKKFVR